MKNLRAQRFICRMTLLLILSLLLTSCGADEDDAENLY